MTRCMYCKKLDGHAEVPRSISRRSCEGREVLRRAQNDRAGECPGIRRRASRPAFALVVMMLAVTLLGIFAVVATRLISSTMTLYREAATIDAEARLTDSALRQLRHDVWASTRVDRAGPQSIKITDGSGRAVAWWVETDGTLVRWPAGAPGAPPDPPRRWAAVGRRLNFEWDGRSLLVRGADRGADRAGGVRMTSQVQLARPSGGQ